LVRLAVEKLFERLDAGEEVVVQKVLRAAGAGAGACSDAQVAKAGSGGKKAASGLSFSGERHRRQRQAVFPMDEKTQP
jgi:hypothetical protein